MAGSCVSLALLAFYDGQRGPGGKFMKWAFYAVYPVHLFVLGLVRFLYIGV
jgi:hypothetical protein